jgi:adenylate kinase
MGLNIILMGVQGAGKGVQASFIRDYYRIPHVSTGDLFRAMKTRTDALARQIQQIMAEGKLISDEITNEVVRERLSQDDARSGVILDGYPRTPAQADWLESFLRERGDGVTAVIVLELDLYEAFRRAFGRVTSVSGESYNVYSNNEGIDWKFVDHPSNEYPPRLEATHKSSGEKLIRRPDDASAHAIIKRIDTYLATTRPLIEYYERKGLLRRVDASRSIEDVSRQIEQVIARTKQSQ